MKTVVPPIPFASSRLGENRDVCAFFNVDDEAYRVLLPFIKGGFECSDKAVHVVAPDQRPDHLRRCGAAKRKFPLNRFAPDTDWTAAPQLHINNLVEGL